MSTQRYISTSFWDDPWVHSLTPNEKLLYLHLMTCPLTNIAGVYEITNDRISFDTGLKSDVISKAMDKFHKDKKAYRYGMYIIIASWPKHQKWETRSKIKSGIEKILVKLDSKLLSYMQDIGYTYPIDKLPIDYEYDSSYSDLDLDIDINKDIEPNTDKEAEEEFNLFWEEYGKKEDRKNCLSKYMTLKSKNILPDISEHIQIIRSWHSSKKWKDGFQPLPKTWLNGERWNDVIPKPITKDNHRKGGRNFEI